MIDALEALLAREEAALVAGDVRAALALQAEKSDILSRVRESASVSEAQLRRIKQSALRNQRLFELAKNAATQANARLSAIAARAERVGYGSDGEALSYADDRSKRRL